ncbi:MAG TPA: lysoplasmalogenase [Myxococcota bacterium]|nr:lysoplasmalogenase [Myxococcota bacterium]
MAVFTGLTLIAVGVLLVAEFRGVRTGVWIAKPLASSGFVAASIASGALESSYGRSVLFALLLCWLGDVLLIPQMRAAFLAGLLSFLLGHLAFGFAFAQRGLARGPAALALVAALAAGLVFLRYCEPHVPAALRTPVRVYVAAISLMLACAAGTAAEAGGSAILLGALMFWLSDLAVARDRFIAPGAWNRLWGLPLYYGAQLVFASTVALANR